MALQENPINYDTLRTQVFPHLGGFRTFCEELGIDFDRNFQVVGPCIDDATGCLAIIGSDGSVKFSISAQLSGEILRIRLDRALISSANHQSPAQPDAVVGAQVGSARAKLECTFLAYCAKGSLKFDETMQEYFVRGYDSAEPRNDVEVRFKIKDIGWVQDYESGDDKSPENDNILYANVMKHLKDLIDSSSVLLLHDRSTTDQKRIEIEVQFDLRRNLQ